MCVVFIYINNDFTDNIYILPSLWNALNDNRLSINRLRISPFINSYSEILLNKTWHSLLCLLITYVFNILDKLIDLRQFKEKLEDTKEVIRSRRTGNTMVKRKRTKGQITIYKTIHKNVDSSITNHTKNWGERGCSGWVSSSYSICDTRRATMASNCIVITWSGTYMWSFVT